MFNAHDTALDPIEEEIDVLARISGHVEAKPNSKVFAAWAESKLGEIHAYTNTSQAVERARMNAAERKRVAERERILVEEQEMLESEKRMLWEEIA